jgi:NitT/TauT family transport system substrate-binding protein
MQKILLGLILLFTAESNLFAQTRFLHSHSGTSSTQGAVWAAKDLGLFEKYGLNVDLVFIPGGARGMQALLGGSTQAADSDGVAPVNVILRGGDAVVIAGLNNKHLFKFIAQKEIREPAELRGKKIGVANFGGSNEFAALIALKKWNVPKEAVTLVAAGGSAVRLAAMEKRSLDATVLPYDNALAASRLGMRVLGDLPELIKSFPDKVITVRRSYLEKERDNVKRYIQALSEGIYQFRTNREKGMAILGRRLKINDPKILEENYQIYGHVFPLPPRVEKEGMRDLLEQMQLQRTGPKSETELARFLDESVIDELEREGFYRKFAVK